MLFPSLQLKTQVIDQAVLLSLLATTCCCIPEITYPLILAQTSKVVVHSALSYLKSKRYISEQFHQSARIVLDPTWAIIFPICTSHLKPVIESVLVDSYLVRAASNLVSYAPEIISSPIYYLAQGSAQKLANAFTSGIITPIAFKTLDRIFESMYLCIDYTFNPNHIASNTKNITLPTLAPSFFTQLVSELSTPFGNLLKGFNLNFATLLTTSPQPKLEGMADLCTRSTAFGLLYATSKHIASVAYIPTFLPDELTRLEIYYICRRAMEQILNYIIKKESLFDKLEYKKSEHENNLQI